jgi:hypothetical protein
MSLIRTALKSGIAVKALQIARREASKPENQRKAKELISKLANRRKGTTHR